jgi:exosome complex RNA-binding protein Rrp42 (RNase PH superfamily)
VDPTSKEEQLTTSSITIVYNEHGQLCGVYKPGGSAISTAHLPACMELAKVKTLPPSRLSNQSILIMYVLY